jgi:PCO_ADO
MSAWASLPCIAEQRCRCMTTLACTYYPGQCAASFWRLGACRCDPIVFLLKNMCTPCRVLYGQLHVLGYDWVDKQQHTAQLAADSSLAADDIAILGPDYGGNMHCLTAVTDVAILDVLAPAYDPKGGTLATADTRLAHRMLILLQSCQSPSHLLRSM